MDNFHLFSYIFKRGKQEREKKIRGLCHLGEEELPQKNYAHMHIVSETVSTSGWGINQILKRTKTKRILWQLKGQKK